MIERKNDWIYNILVTEYQFVSYDNLVIVIQCIKWASFIHSCIGWSFDSLFYTVSQSISLTFISDSNQKQIIEWLSDWSSCSRFVAHRLWEGFRKENHWTDLVLFIQSHKYPIAIHNIGPLYQLLCFCQHQWSI